MSDGVLIELSGDDLGPAESAALTDALRREILGLREVEGVTRPSAGAAPAGSRAVDPASLTALVVAIPPAVEQVTKLVKLVKDWRRRNQPESHALTITVAGNTLELSATTDQQDQLVDQYLATLAGST